MTDIEIADILAQTLELAPEKIAGIGEEEDLRSYGLESVNAIRIVVLAEEKFGIAIDDSELNIGQMETINKIKKLIAKYL